MKTLVILFIIFFNLISMVCLGANPEAHTSRLNTIETNDNERFADSTYSYYFKSTSDSVVRFKKRYAYDKQMNLILDETLDYNSPSAKWFYTMKKAYSFDNKGNIIKQINYDTRTEEPRISSILEFVYNSNNIIVARSWYNYDENNKESRGKEERIFNEKEEMTGLKRYEYNYESAQWLLRYRIECIVDEFGNITEMKDANFNHSGNKWINESKYNYEYDASNRKTKEITSLWRNEDWAFYYKVEYEYQETALGFLTVELKYNWNSEKEIWEIVQKNEITKNEFGVVVDNNYTWSETTGMLENTSQYLYDYDSLGNMILNEYYERSSDTLPWTGKEKKIWEFDSEHQVSLTMSFVWNDNTLDWIKNGKREYNINDSILYHNSKWVDSLNYWENESIITEFFNHDSSTIYEYYSVWDAINDRWNKRTLDLHFKSFQNTVLVTNNQIQSNLSLFPNPCVNSINWQISNNEPVYSIQIYNQQGQLLKNSIPLKNNSIVVSDLSTGVYFITFNLPNNTVTKKIIKK